MTADPDAAATAATTAAMAALDAHRWKSMGVASVQCECGAILYGDESLTQFPADEAFRRHVAESVIHATASHIRVDAYETGKQVGATAERERCARLAERQRFIHFAGMIRSLADGDTTP